MPVPSVLDVLASRRSVRAFLPDPVPRETLCAILGHASRSPSASNTQPWRVHACAGPELRTLSGELVRLHYAGGGDHAEEYPYYPADWGEPYLGRRRQVGKDLYGLIGIPKGDAEAMLRQYARNYACFDAPLALFFTIERRLVTGHAAWMDLGAFVHAVMLAARHFGLDTCAQQAFARYHAVIRRHLPIAREEIVVCGMSMGRADSAHPANRLVTRRAPVADFASFTGF